MLKTIVISTIAILAAACQSLSPAFQQTLSAGDLTAEYVRSKADVRQKYDGKEVSVRGYAPVQASMPRDDEYEGLLRLEEEKNFSLQVLCRFTRNEASKFAAIKGGEYVTVKGVFNGERGTELRFCTLVNIE